MKKVAFLTVLLLITTAAMAADKDMKSMMPAPNPMLRELDFLGGNWQCEGIAYATPMGPEHPTRAAVSGRWQMDGQWLAITYAEKKTAQNAMPFSVNAFFGYDAEVKQLVVGSVDSGGGYSTAASPGMQGGDSLTFVGPWHMGGMTANGRDVFTKKSATEMTHTAEIEQNGSWMKLGQETCRR
jgi:hypothetical protein